MDTETIAWIILGILVVSATLIDYLIRDKKKKN